MLRVVFWIFAVVATAFAVWFLSRDLLPPKSLTFAAGPEGGGYEAIAERYRQILARDGIDVTVLSTAGSVENAELLSRGDTQAALLQGGITPAGETDTLGAVFLEPLFIFVRADGEVPANPATWTGLRIAAGAAGSGTRAAVTSFAEAADIALGENGILPIGGADAADALLAGETDIAIFVAPVGAGYLLPLFQSDAVTLLRLDNIETLNRRLPQSELIDLPSGAFSLVPTVPETTVAMLSLAARLAAVPDLHPSLVDRLVEAAVEIHGPRDAISDDGDFPTMDFAMLPADAYARDLIASGPSPLGRYLPYWVVAQVSRFAILIVPILFLLFPLIRALPGLYVWRMRWRVFRHYSTIRALDHEAAATSDPGHLDELKQRIDRLDEEIAGLHLPPAYRDFAYTARLHIDLVRKRVSDKQEAMPGFASAPVR